MAIGEILLGAFLQVLFEKLASLGLDYARREGPPPFPGFSIDLLNKWKHKLDTINAVLDDAEDKQLSGKGPVKLWLDDVRDLAYDMEDLLDEFEIEATRAKSKAESSTSGGLVKWKFPFVSHPKSSILNPSLCSLVSETEVQKINDRLEEIVTRKAQLSLTENFVNRSSKIDKKLPSSSLPEPQFLGREKEEAEILELLIGEAENDDSTLSIVPIVGMGGVGKTALAQRLYNYASVRSYFERRAWVCVSDVFNVIDITKTILRSITGSSNQDEDLNMLQVKLKESLSGRKFLVVLDDVWNENYGEWTALLAPFEAGAKGSKIIVTTRNRDVVYITGALPYPLEELSLDNCTSLLAFHALKATNFERYPHLETIGKKIAEKCKGSPLAAKVLGGLLRGKENRNQWEAILNNKMWDLPMGENSEVLRVLKLSYVHLPAYLKRYFVYCAVFPKDYEIERDELILLWIAEGLLDGRRAKENILKLGRIHFDELVSRSFLQQASVDTSKFSMHDLLNDLAKSIAGGTCFSSVESQLAGSEDDTCLERVRYASFIPSSFVTAQCLRAYHGMKALRSLFLMHVGFSEGSFSISNKVLHDLLTNLKYLRAFSLCHCHIVEVPNYVGELKHIRYLNFSYTDIKSLPESIGDLCKLQALILRGCQYLSKLPQGITKLVSLQFLDIRGPMSLKEMPLGMSNLENLTVLSKFVVGPEKGSQLKELQNLSHLEGELLISDLQKVKEVKDVANLSGKKGLSNLFLCWDEDFGNLRNEKRESQVLCYLQPHTNLENLTISYYGGANFPSWLGASSYTKIASLCLRGCPNVEMLPSLGELPSLKELSLEGLHAIRTIGSEFYGSKRPFSSLTALKFEDMLAWKDWSPYVGGPEEEIPFSSLQHLVFRSCPSLVGTLPCQLDYLTKLEIFSCPNLDNSTSVVSLPSLSELHLEDCNKEILRILINLTSLTILRIQNFDELVCFDRGFMSRLVRLKDLDIGGCDKLNYLWQDGNETRNLTCLQIVIIKRCPQFTSFVAGDGEIELPCNLERMELRDCASLEKLPSKMHAVRDLRIKRCPKITRLTIPPDGPSSNNPMPQLESLKVSHCDSLTSFSFAEGRLTALKTMEIKECKGVESLGEITVAAESLESFTIWSCESLRSLPRCLHALSNLTHLYIADCPKIKALPNQWHHLTSLQSIHISNCPNIECFPEGGFPPNLRSLGIWGCKNVKQPVREWGLPLLTSLQCLEIDFGRSMGGEGEEACFPSEEDAWSLLFPSSLTWLGISNMRKVERLSSSLRNHLSSLGYLGILDCPKLRCLPEDGLPPSLHILDIRGCSNLIEGCSKLTGHYWPLIQEIPVILINSVQIR